MKHLPLGRDRYVPKQYIFETMNARVPYHNIKSMVGSGAKKKDVGSMKPITLEGEGVKSHRTLQPLRFRM
jgi:hypothetical protein